MKNKTTKPAFSTVMAVYNDPEYVGLAIDSVIAQTYPNWEFVIVDDGSDDGRTPQMIRKFAKKDSRIRVIRNESNQMLGPSLNTGVREARGRWITRIDSDDVYHPEYLERLAAWVKGVPNGHVFFTSWVRIIDDLGRAIVDYSLPKGEFIRRMSPFENLIYHTATAYPKSLWQEAGGYPDNRRKRVDYVLWKRFYAKHAQLSVIPEVLVDYRAHGCNMTVTGLKDGKKIELNDKKTRLKRREWRIYLYLRQVRLREARREIRLFIKDVGKLSLKNALYYLVTYLPRGLARFIMWNVRPVLRFLIRTAQGKNKF